MDDGDAVCVGVLVFDGVRVLVAVLEGVPVLVAVVLRTQTQVR